MGVDALHFEPHLPWWVGLWPLALIIAYTAAQYRVGRRFGSRGLVVGWLVACAVLTAGTIAMRALANVQVLGRPAVPDAGWLVGTAVLVGVPGFGLAARSVRKRLPRLAGASPRLTDLLAGVGAWFVGAMLGLLPALLRDIVALAAGR